MRCPYCGEADSNVIDTNHDARGGVRRRRKCLKCSQRFSTYERAVLATPTLIKQDGNREESDGQAAASGFVRVLKRTGEARHDRGGQAWP